MPEVSGLLFLVIFQYHFVGMSPGNNRKTSMMNLRLVAFVASIAFAAGQTPCPVDLFMGNWSGSCVQTVGMNSACASPDACATAGVADLRLSPGWNAVSSTASCTQKYDFRFFTLQACGSVVVGLYICSFIQASVLFFRCKMLNPDKRVLVWRYYSVFTALIASGSLCGAVAWGSRMGQRILQ